jgi:hypothetical protein
MQHLAERAETLYNLTKRPRMILRMTTTVPISFALLFLLSTGCYGEDLNGKPVPFETIEQGGNSGVRTGKTLAIHDSAAWNMLWLEHKKNSSLASAAPEIDFSKEMVIAVFLGERRTGGHAISIKSLSAGSQGLNVTYQENRPGKGCMLIMALTFPFQIVRLARIDGPVTFSPEVRIQNCSSR